MKRINKHGGFTLIELLVVIAIIGILASIILVSLNSARKKGNDTRVISDVNQIRTQLETDYNGSNYSADLAGPGNGLITSSGLKAPNQSANIGTLSSDANSQSSPSSGVMVTASGTPVVAYAVYAQLVSNSNYFCIDSTGYATTTSSVSETSGTCGE